MRDKWTSGVFGIAFIVLGVLYGLNAFSIWSFNIFFNGFWTLFIIIPSVISILKNGFSTGSTICLALGSIWLLSAQGFLNDGVAGKLIFPMILVVIGINIVRKNLFQREYNNRISVKYSGEGQDYTAVFGGSNYKVEYEKFNGASVNAIFGGVEVDLRNSYIDEDVVINASAIFGGVEIYVPSNVRVKITGIPIFGGIENNVKNELDETAPIVYINATCMFGGIEVSWVMDKN